MRTILVSLIATIMVMGTSSHILEPLADDLACSVLTLTAASIKKRYKESYKAHGKPS